MPPVFDLERCMGCGLCVRQCPGDVLRMSDGGVSRPYARYPRECWHCASCRQDCPRQAVVIRFPPDMLTW